jgi:FKBP-type peptidyl-prolyl cis-trans isomerase SlyD
MSAEAVVADKKVVTIHYSLKNAAGEQLDSSQDGEPMAYLHGALNIVPGLESALDGKTVGTALDVVVAPKDGYGERGPEPFPVGLDAFPEDMELAKGLQFVAEQDGEMIPFWIDRVEETQVFIDPNHPLAGVELHFQVEVVAIRDATEEELEHGHPHGPGGAQH